MPVSIPPFTPTALQPNSAETFATYVRGQPAAKIPLSGSELFPILQNGTIVRAPATSLIGTITVGGSTIFGSTDKTILFDKAGVIGEDTNLEWDYTNHILNLGPNARLNSIGTTWEFDVGGTNKLDYGITNSGAWSIVHGSSIFSDTFNSASLAGNFGGVYIKLNTDGTNNRIAFALQGTDRAFAGWGPGGAANVDSNIFRYASGVLGLSGGDAYGGATSAAGWQVYNSVDTVGNPTNYERGVFDWTTTANVLTIGTQKGGTGSTRNIQFVVGGTNQLDFGITNAGQWTSAADFDATIFNAVGGVNSFAGLYVGQTADVHFRIGFALDSNNRGLFALGAGGSAQVDTHIERYGAGIMGVTGGDPYGGASAPAGFQVYKTFDTIGNPTNYERGVFDWTTTSNVLTIGTQKGGSGSTRNIQFVVGNTGVLDYGITNSGNWTFVTAGIKNQFNLDNTSGSSFNGQLSFQGSGSEKWSLGNDAPLNTTDAFFLYTDSANTFVPHTIAGATLNVVYPNGWVLGFSSNANVTSISTSTLDVGVARVAGHCLEINNGTIGTGPGVILPRPTTFANLPASPTQGMMASITDGLAGNCGDGSCTTFGTNVTGGTGALKLNLWYNGTHWTLIGK